MGDEHIKEATNEKANARTGSERELSDLAALRPAGRFSGGKRVGSPWSFAQTNLFDMLFFCPSC